MNNLREAHRRLVAACSERSWRDDPEDPNKPETIQAMQIALNLPKQDPPKRTEVLEAAARGVVKLCLDDRAGQDGAFAEALGQWYGHRIRKVARRARNKAWRDVQALPGVTVENRARVFLPSAVQDVHPLVAKLQIGHTDLPQDEPGPALADDPTPVTLTDEQLKLNNLPDVVARWHSRTTDERERARTDYSFTVPKEEIAQADYDLSMNRYKEIVLEVEETRDPMDIIAEIEELDRDITQGLANLKTMLSEGK